MSLVPPRPECPREAPVGARPRIARIKNRLAKPLGSSLPIL